MEMPGFSTPASTTGMGNPIAPGESGEVGSGDAIAVSQDVKEKPKKKMKSLKDYIKDKKK